MQYSTSYNSLSIKPLGVNWVFTQKVMLKTQYHIIIIGPEGVVTIKQ